MHHHCTALPNPEELCASCPDRGACCRCFTDLSVAVLLTDEEAAAFPEAVATSIGSFLPVKPGTGECIFLDPDGWCGVHHIRKPTVCAWWHCRDDFEENGSPSQFLTDHPHICTWLKQEST